jgi:RimJ/RimL family protein N-acetyltransferase
MIIEGFQTKRLLVAPWTLRLGQPNYHEVLREMLTPLVLAHLPPPLQVVADIDAWVADRNAESDVYDLSVVGTSIGLLILAQIEPGQIHIGYLLAENAWGKGYASELVQGLVVAAPLNATLIGGVDSKNPASARVLEKAGFAKDDVNTTDDHATYFLAISKDVARRAKHLITSLLRPIRSHLRSHH